MVQTAPDQVPPEVPVKLPGMPPNKGGWTWPEALKNTRPLGLVDGEVVCWMGLYICLLHTTKTQEEEKEVEGNSKKRRGCIILR